MNASLLPDYKLLKQSSISALREHGNSILAKGATFFNGDTSMLLPLVAGLTTANILAISPMAVNQLAKFGYGGNEVSRVHAGNVVCAIRLLTGLDAECSGLGASLVERVRAIVALRGYAEGETSPQVVQEMWELHKALIAAGHLEEAEEVERDAFRRIKLYVQDIPVNVA
jgi:hypothetical protein